MSTRSICFWVAGFGQSIGLSAVHDYWILHRQHQGTDGMGMVG
jgi:hypothetical protein